MSFRTDAVKLAYQAAGSHKTRDGRQNAMRRLADHLQKHNIQIRQVKHMKEKHIRHFISTRKEAGIGLRTLQNEMAAIRAVLRQAKHDKLADRIDNKSLGIAGASRAGTKASLSDERFAQLRAEVAARDASVAAAVDLQRYLGLRAEEAVKAFKSLGDWQRQLERGLPVHLIYGSKGGRPRHIHPVDRDRALEAVKAARAIAKKQGGFLIDKPGEKEAMNRYFDVMKAAGFRGKESGHSLRYTFAQRQIAAYQAQGFSQRDALAKTSMDLGHGDGRGRYINQVYGKTEG